MPTPPFSPADVAAHVTALAHSSKPIAPLVQEALDVIDQALDTHGFVFTLNYLFWSMVDLPNS